MTDKNIDVEKLYNYWLESSERDFKTMQNLYTSKDYHWALFIGHLVLEKLFKAIIVKRTKDHAPFTHDLRRLAKHSGLEFEKEHYHWLDTITTFNLNARYDSYKQDFYQKCTSEFTEEWFTNITTLREWIKMKL